MTEASKQSSSALSLLSISYLTAKQDWLVPIRCAQMADGFLTVENQATRWRLLSLLLRGKGRALALADFVKKLQIQTGDQPKVFWII